MYSLEPIQPFTMSSVVNFLIIGILLMFIAVLLLKIRAGGDVLSPGTKEGKKAYAIGAFIIAMLAFTAWVISLYMFYATKKDPVPQHTVTATLETVMMLPTASSSGGKVSALYITSDGNKVVLNTESGKSIPLTVTLYVKD